MWLGILVGLSLKADKNVDVSPDPSFLNPDSKKILRLCAENVSGPTIKPACCLVF